MSSQGGINPQTILGLLGGLGGLLLRLVVFPPHLVATPHAWWLYGGAADVSDDVSSPYIFVFSISFAYESQMRQIICPLELSC